jgi:drug/metabolite transporter (DMT)-like permease
MVASFSSVARAATVRGARRFHDAPRPGKTGTDDVPPNRGSAHGELHRRPMLTGLLFALGATVLNSVAGLLESDGARYVTHRRPLGTQPRYLGGLVVDGLGWVCTVVALRWLPVFVVQAVLGGAIALTALGARVCYGSMLRRIDRWAIAGCTVGLVLIAGSAGPEQPLGVSTAAVLALLAAAGLLALALVALRSSGRAWPLGVVAGLGFGGTSVAVRAVHRSGDADPVTLLGQPAVYALLAFWVVGMIAYSWALTLTSVAELTAMLLVTEIVVPGLVGIVLLGDSVRAGWWWVLGLGFALAVTGVTVLARSPVQRPPPPQARHRS